MAVFKKKDKKPGASGGTSSVETRHNLKCGLLTLNKSASVLKGSYLLSPNNGESERREVSNRPLSEKEASFSILKTNGLLATR
jgi:hypothetical protein